MPPSCLCDSASTGKWWLSRIGVDGNDDDAHNHIALSLRLCAVRIILLFFPSETTKQHTYPIMLLVVRQ